MPSVSHKRQPIPAPIKGGKTGISGNPMKSSGIRAKQLFLLFLQYFVA
jgi:hypothetical protein